MPSPQLADDRLFFSLLFTFLSKMLVSHKHNYNIVFADDFSSENQQNAISFGLPTQLGCWVHYPKKRKLLYSYLWSGSSQENASSFKMFDNLALLGKNNAKSVAKIQCFIFPSTCLYSSGFNFAKILWDSCSNYDWILNFHSLCLKMTSAPLPWSTA